MYIFLGGTVLSERRGVETAVDPFIRPCVVVTMVDDGIDVVRDRRRVMETDEISGHERWMNRFV